MNNFSINPNFNLSGFQNQITDYNKSFNTSLDSANKSFDEVFQSVSSQKPLQASIETIDSAPKELSETAKMAQDIKQSFSNGINELNYVQRSAEEDFETFAAGGDISVHEVMISAQKSSLAMQMAIQLRNQMLNAYSEFKNMQI